MADEAKPGSWMDRAVELPFPDATKSRSEGRDSGDGPRGPRREAEVRPLRPPVAPEEPDPAAGSPRPAGEDRPVGAGSPLDGPGESDALLEAGLEELREEALRWGREDAEVGVPELDVAGRCESERRLLDRARSLYDRWKAAEHRRLDDLAGVIEERIHAIQSRLVLSLDRLERVTNELVRLKARVAKRRWEVSEELKGEREIRSEGLSTRVYVSAIVFLGSVEFFANAPVFSALLPRDPLSDRQMRLVTETTQGWLAGAERVIAHIIFRPDAALLAAGVVTFLCVLAHFFGHSLRDLVVKRDRQVRREAVASRSPLENIIPMVLTGIGLALVLSVLFEARTTLGEVGRSQYKDDMAAVQDLRRQAALMRSDGDLLAANQKTNQADDMQTAAEDLRDYATSMSRMSFPILLLNMTLVLCALTAAYFHRRDGRRERFDESPYEDERHALIERGEDLAEQAAGELADLSRAIRRLRSTARSRPAEDWHSVVRRLEAAVGLYRTENGRVRERDPRSLPAFSEPPSLGVDPERAAGQSFQMIPVDEYVAERDRLAGRFQDIRERFLGEALAG